MDLIKQFLQDRKNYSTKVAWFNLKFSLCYKWLGARRMKVDTRWQGEEGRKGW